MKQLNELPQVADTVFSELKADDRLKERIRLAAAEQTLKRQAAGRKKILLRALPVACCLVLLVTGILLIKRPAEDEPEVLTSVYAAGSSSGSAEPRLSAGAGLNNRDMSVTNVRRSGSSRSILEGKDSSFPLIRLEGRYYRMCTSPASVSSSLLGKEAGTVSEFTAEPALSSGNGILSNTVTVGTPVFRIKSMGNTFVAAEVKGVYRVFQRIAFNGNALIGREGFTDAAGLKGHVVSLEVTGDKIIEDRTTAEKLFEMMADEAVFDGNGSLSGKTNLIFTLDNGLQYQFTVKGNKISACGTWSCPDFFEILSGISVK